MALLEFRKGLENVFTMVEYVEEAERLFRLGNDINGLGACSLIYGQICRLSGDTVQALELFEEARELHTESSYEWGMAAGRYFAAEAMRDLAESDRSRVPEAVALLHDALQRFWNMGDFWGAGGAMSGLACIAAMQGVDQQAATYFGAAGVLMDRVGGSLLPSELMTHHETEAELKARMSPAIWNDAYAAGARAPEQVVEIALADSDELLHQIPDAAQPAPRLTRRQMTIVQDLVQGYDIPTIANRRGRSVSATYELVDRILERLSLTDWDEIAPFAVKQGLVHPPQPRPGFIPPH
jgi:tetratricopeptide (TPR) repeat protein